MKTGLAWVILVLAIATMKTSAAGPEGGLDPGRVREIAAWLGDLPFGFGPRIGDRDAWRSLAKVPGITASIRLAERFAKESLSALPDELYLEYSRNGSRGAYENALRDRTFRLAPLVLAECLEDKGRFLPAIEELIAAICAQRTWVLPAHDLNQENFLGRRITIDLVSSLTAHELAQVAWMMETRLSEETRKRIAAEIHRRVLDPFREMLAGTRAADRWITADNNWNAVCLSEVTGAALACLESRDDRALFAAAAEKYTLNYLRGFGTDGYCAEGLGYWTYGFSNYIKLAELLGQATGGKLDLYDRPIVSKIVLFPRRLEIVGNIYPAYGDSTVYDKPEPRVMEFLNRRFELGIPGLERAIPVDLKANLASILMHACAGSGSRPAAMPQADIQPGLRSWFDEAQVLACRPAAGSAGRIAVSLKGGRHGGSHSHSDIGSYVVVVGGSRLLLDPGAEVYTARTFGKNRYQNKVLNSFGHAVPLVAGALQRTDREAAAKVLRRDFTDAADTLALDLRTCYAAPALTKLEREFVYRRAGEGALTIADTAEFSSAQTFGTTLITMSRWRQLSPSTLLVYDDKEAVRVEIDTMGASFVVHAEQIDENVKAPVKPTRIGIDLQSPAARATIALHLTPASPSLSE